MKQPKIGFYILKNKYFGLRSELFYWDGTIPKDWDINYSGIPYRILSAGEGKDRYGYMPSDMEMASSQEVIKRIFK